MKITHKLVISFWFIVICIWSVSFYAITTTKNKLEKILVTQDLRLAQQLTNEMSHLIYSRLETTQEYTKDVLLRTTLEDSNTFFAERGDIDKYINDIDEQWTGSLNSSENSVLNNLLANGLSEELREKQEYYSKKYGYDLYQEIFATNRYGAVVGITNRTSDYRQDDEKWWKEAQKSGQYISDVAYHESIDAYSLDFSIRVTNEQDIFLGVLKAVYNVDEILRLMKRAQQEESHAVLDYILVTQKGEALYSSTKQEQFMGNLSHQEYVIKASGKSGYFTLGKDNKFYIYAKVPDYLEMTSPGWTLIVVHNMDDVFAPVITLRNKLFILASAITFFIFLLSLFVIYFVSKPLVQLRNAVVSFGRGQLDGEVLVSTRDEIGEVAAAFNTMRATLQETTVSRDSLVAEIVERKRLEKEISESEQRLSSIIESLLSGILIIDAETHKIVDANPAAIEILGMTKEKLIGQECHLFICPAGKDNCPITDSGGTFDHSERTLVNHKGENIPVLKSVSSETINGRLCFIESFVDISDLKKAEQEKEKLISKLQKALAQVKTLSGIVPICMHCKNIRDDKGYWNEVSKFVAEHSEAEFSHGICEQCLEKYYPEIAEEIKAEKKQVASDPDSRNQDCQNKP